MFGAMRGGELAKLAFKDVSEQGNLFIIWVRKPKNKEDRYFTITGPCCGVVKKYIDLRPRDSETERFFINYQKGRCLKQVIGKQKFTQMPRRIAEFLELPDVEQYTGHSFRRSSASMFANTGAGIEAVKNIGGWKSAKVAEGYVVNSLSYKKRTSDTFSSLLSEEPVPSTSATNSLSIVNDKHHVGPGPNKKPKVTSTTASSVSMQGSESYEIEISELSEQAERCVSSEGYSDITYDDITDAELLSVNVVEKSKQVEETSKHCVLSQGYVQNASDNIMDAEMENVIYEEPSTANALNAVRSHFSFIGCNVKINFKK